MVMGVAVMIITSDYGSFPHSLLSTSKYKGKKRHAFPKIRESHFL